VSFQNQGLKAIVISWLFGMDNGFPSGTVRYHNKLLKHRSGRKRPPLDARLGAWFCIGSANFTQNQSPSRAPFSKALGVIRNSRQTLQK